MRYTNIATQVLKGNLNMKYMYLTAAALTFAFMSGCSSSVNNTVSTNGSTSMEKVIGYLSEAYSEIADIKVTYNPTGSGSGIQAVLDGRCDIGLSSRQLKNDEKENLDSTVLAIDGIAVVVNTENPVSNLTSEQIALLYTGQITNWSEVGGEDMPVVCIGREAASGTRDGFESVTGTVDSCVYSQELTSAGDVVRTVSSNPNAIGYSSLESVGNDVKTVSIDGVMPSEENILSGEYNLQRDFILVTAKDRQLTENAQNFFDFMMSDEADYYIREAGAIPSDRGA
jgi:phosphate transport system substrate-binding protein